MMTTNNSNEFEELFTEFMTEPALGARSKREIEIKFVELSYRARLNDISVSQVAVELKMPRQRAANLLLEARLRANSAESVEARNTRLAEVLNGGTDGTGFVDIDENRLTFVIDNPELREKLQNFASANKVPIDESHAAGLVTISWKAWCQLLALLSAPAGVDEKVIVKQVAKNLKSQTGLLQRDELRKALNKLSSSQVKSVADVVKILGTVVTVA